MSSSNVAMRMSRPSGQVIVSVLENSIECREHEPVRSEVELLGDDGEYESSPATLCRKCKRLLAVDTGN